MNLISNYQNISKPYQINQQSQPNLESLKKLITTIIQRFRQQTVTIISPPITNHINYNIQTIPQKLTYILLQDSKLSNYSYSFQVQANFILNKFKIVATILKNGIMLNINKESHSQILCSYALSINSLANNYSFRVHPYTGTVKYIYVTQCADKVINDMFVYPADSCERIKKQIEEMVNKLDQRILGKILHITNQIPMNHILPTNFDTLLSKKNNTQQNIQEINKIQSLHPLFPQGTLNNIYNIVNNYKQIRKHLCNCTIKYPFFSMDQQSNKIRFFPQINIKKRQPQKQQKIIRHNIKIMPFTKQIKNVIKLYVSLNQLQNEQNLYGKGQSLWIQPTQNQIKQIFNVLAVKNFTLGGRILNNISIHSIQSQITIGAGGFAEIRRAIVYFSKRDTQNPQAKNNMSQLMQAQKFRHAFVRKVAANQKLSWEKLVIKHIGRGECLFIHKYFDAKVDPSAAGLQKNIFDDCLFMQYCQERSLNNYLSKMHSIISTKTKVFLIYQVSVGLRFLRDNGVVHLDVKPENILIKMASTGSSSFALAKIIDFGQAYCQILLHKRMNRGHTCPYGSPQLVRQSDKYSQKSDVFSLGVMILIMVFDLNTVDIKRLTSNIIFQSNERYIKFYSICIERCKYFGYEPVMQCLLNLAYKCLNPNTSARPYLNWICVILRDLLNIFEELQR